MIAPEPLPPREVVLDAAWRALAQKKLHCPVGVMRGLVLARADGIDLVLVRVEEIDTLKAQILPLFSSQLAFIGPIFTALDHLAEMTAGDGLPILVLSHKPGGGVGIDQAILAVPPGSLCGVS